MSGLSAHHCPHCWGDCSGTCLRPGLDGCIHQAPKVPLEIWLRGVRTRRFWRRILVGAHGSRLPASN